MKNKTEIKEAIKQLESIILGDIVLNISDLQGLEITGEDNLKSARKTLLWVAQKKPRVKKEDNDKKLKEFKVDNPFFTKDVLASKKDK